jgi:hypothetical protein
MAMPEDVDSGKGSAKRNLVIVRAGDNSLHPAWLLPENERSWDLVVSYYGDDPDIHKADGIRRVDRKGTEYPAFHALLTDPGFDWAGYEYIWLPDDDLAADGRSINRFFELCRKHELALAQPSLDHASHISYPITLQDDRFVLRWTNIVEVMAPCFSRVALLACLDTFSNSQSSYGLDFLWSHRIGGERNIAIVDEVSIRHTRPVGGPLYALLESMGVDVEAEKRQCLAELGTDRFVVRLHGGLMRNGRTRSYGSRLPGLAQIAKLLLQKEFVAAYLVRDAMRGTGGRSISVKIADQAFAFLGIPERWFGKRAEKIRLAGSPG